MREIAFDILAVGGGYGIDDNHFAHFSVKSFIIRCTSADLIESGRIGITFVYSAVLKSTVD